MEIIKTMASLHFSTIDLRNKISQGCINNNIPIITQVTSGNYQPGQGQGQVRVEIYPLLRHAGEKLEVSSIEK